MCLFCWVFALTVCLTVLSDFGDSLLYTQEHESQYTLSHIVCCHIPMHPHMRIQTHTSPCIHLCKYSHTHWEAVRLRGMLCLCSSVFYTLFSCTPSTFSLSHGVPFCLPFCSCRFSPLFPAPIFPSHLLSSHTLPYRLPLCVNFKVCIDSVFCRCSIFKAFLGWETSTSDAREEKIYIYKKGQTLNRSHLKHRAYFLYEVGLSSLQEINRSKTHCDKTAMIGKFGSRLAFSDFVVVPVVHCWCFKNQPWLARSFETPTAEI